jgi:hypothetical protein
MAINICKNSILFLFCHYKTLKTNICFQMYVSVCKSNKIVFNFYGKEVASLFLCEGRTESVVRVWDCVLISSPSI